MPEAGGALMTTKAQSVESVKSVVSPFPGVTGTHGVLFQSMKWHVNHH
ncbi:hypothetical protein SBDP1_420004 [Syntrophobacter sp. SbD1]|nr:hypothetical protein SBDP1_420004 [Syntrophobacter sp. SbD1]